MEPTANNLPILQSYPLGTLTVEGPFPNSQYPGSRRVVLGLSISEGKPVIETNDGAGRTDYSFAEYFTPVLRPFSSLCLPLEDGTIPAVEVARMMMAAVIDPLRWNDAATNEDEDRIEVQVPSAKAHTYPWILHIHTDFTIMCYNSAGIEKEVTAWKAIDYLRRHHFAVGLEPGDFIPLLP